MSIDNITRENICVLLQIGEGDVLKIIENNKIVVDNDEFQEINSSLQDLELNIVNTLFYEIFRNKSNYKDFVHSINNIDVILDNIYENKYLCELIEKSDFFSSSLTSVNDKYYDLRDKYQKNKCTSNILRLNDLFNTFLNNIITTARMIHNTNMVVLGIETSDDEETSEDEETSGGEETCEENELEKTD